MAETLILVFADRTIGLDQLATSLGSIGRAYATGDGWLTFEHEATHCFLHIGCEYDPDPPGFDVPVHRTSVALHYRASFTGTATLVARHLARGFPPLLVDTDYDTVVSGADLTADVLREQRRAFRGAARHPPHEGCDSP